MMDQRHASLRVLDFALPFLGVVFATALIAPALPACAAAAPVTVGGPFTLQAADGATVTDATFRGKWLLVFFGYTFCPDTCPTTLSQIALSLQHLGADAAKVHPIFITVDPARDTPEVMRQYTEAFDPRIVGLTGSYEQISAVMQEYGVYTDRHETGASGDHTLNHSTYIYIMDPRGRFVLGVDSDSPGSDIADTVRSVIAKSTD